MPRLHLFELEDQPWFPATIRDLATDYLRFAEAQFSLHRPVVKLLADALRETGQTRIVDLCAGGGGPIPSLMNELAEAGVDATIVLTDFFPNRPAFEAVAATSDGAITYRTDPVDAKAVPRNLAGFRTVFNAFHHFAPDDAKAMLRDAVAAGQPVGVFEIPDRRWGTILPMLLFMPLIVALSTPFIRPFRWSRLVWTYVIPLVPFTVWWDGVVSQLRAYTAAELEHLAADFPGYTWNSGTVPVVTAPGRLTYLMGWPKG